MSEMRVIEIAIIPRSDRYMWFLSCVTNRTQGNGMNPANLSGEGFSF
jgi:hypothetical protein